MTVSLAQRPRMVHQATKPNVVVFVHPLAAPRRRAACNDLLPVRQRVKQCVGDGLGRRKRAPHHGVPHLTVAAHNTIRCADSVLSRPSLKKRGVDLKRAVLRLGVVFVRQLSRLGLAEANRSSSTPCPTT